MFIYAAGGMASPLPSSPEQTRPGRPLTAPQTAPEPSPHGFPGKARRKALHGAHGPTGSTAPAHPCASHGRRFYTLSRCLYTFVSPGNGP